MLSKVKSIGLVGLEGFEIEVETEITQGLETVLNVVGLPDAAVKEARERIRRLRLLYRRAKIPADAAEQNSNTI